MSSQQPFILVLSGHYDRDRGLDNYLLVLIHAHLGQVNQWLCTSSHVTGQQRGDQHTRGGLIPPVHHCQNLKKWEVDLEPINLSHVRGVEGNFYRILPFQVLTTKKVKRGDFGVHLDANAPGSLGCPVMNKKNWVDFERTIQTIKAKTKLARIPLFPMYS